MKGDLEFITARLDVRNLDETITKDQIKAIHVEYKNIGEDADWTEKVPFEVIQTEEALGASLVVARDTTLELETEAETEEEAVANIQQELNRSSNYHPADIGEWERIEPEPYDALGDPEVHGVKLGERIGTGSASSISSLKG